MDSFNSSNKAKNKTFDETSNDSIACKPLDDLDELDAEKNDFQKETLNLFKAEKTSSRKKTKAQKEDKEEACSSNVLMDDITLNPIAVKEDITVPEPECNPAGVQDSPVSSTMRQHLLVEESENYKPDESDNGSEPMSISSSPVQIHSDHSSPVKVRTPSLLRSEQILASSGYIEHEMELLLYEEKEISTQSTLLEHKLREVEGEGQECDDLLQLWFHLVSRKNMAFHRRLMLEILQSEQDLEKRCELLQGELRRGGREELGEKLLLEELLRVVDLRDQLVMARDREETSLQDEVKVGREVKNRLNTQDNKRDKCKSQ